MNAIFLLKAKNSLAFLQDDNTLRQGLERMRARGYTAIPVINQDGAYVGSISEGDFLWHILDKGDDTMKALEGVRVADIIRRDWNPAVRVDVSLEDLLKRVLNQNFVPVVDDRNFFIGIITRRDVIQYFTSEESSENIK